MTTAQKVRAMRRAIRQIATDEAEAYHDPYTVACSEGRMTVIIHRSHRTRAVRALRTLRLPRELLFTHLERLVRVEARKKPDHVMPWGPQAPEAFEDLSAADHFLGD